MPNLLTLQFLAWVESRPRTYAETRQAWRSTCPSTCAWEDALSESLVFPYFANDDCSRHGVLVSSSQHPGTPSYAAAELTWGLVLAAMRQIPQQAAALKAGKWQIGVGSSLRGKTLGIFGYGRIGGGVAGYGRAFGMKVQIWGRDASLRRAGTDGYAVAASKPGFFADCDTTFLQMSP